MKVVQAFTREQAVDFLAFADCTLAAPPAKPWIERFPGRGQRVLRLAFPIGMVQGANDAVRHRPVWALTKDRATILAAVASQMAAQATSAGVHLGIAKNGRGVIPTWPSPLPGRPMLRCVRFSARPSDDTSAWWKTIGDVLLPARPARVSVSKRTGKRRVVKAVAGLGVLSADGPDALLTRFWCEPAPKGAGGALVEVWTG